MSQTGQAYRATPGAAPASQVPASLRPAVRSNLGLPLRQRHWGRAAAGGLLVVGCALAGALAFVAAQDTRPVLALATDVAEGETIERADLVAVGVSGDVQALDATEIQIDELVGTTAATDLFEGQLLLDSAVTTDPVPGPGEALIGMSLPPSQVPGAGLAASDRVLVYALPPSEGGGAAGIPLPGPVEATVFSLRGADTSAGRETVVTVQVASEDAASLVPFAAAGLLAVVEQSSGG